MRRLLGQAFPVRTTRKAVDEYEQDAEKFL